MTVNNQPINRKEYEKAHEPNSLQESSIADEITRKMSQIQHFGREISAFINGFQLNVDRDNGAVQINLRKKTRPLVELIPLLKYCEEIKSMEAIIGWNKTQEPMLWAAGPLAKNHLLISGTSQAGKTGLLRSLILTLVLATRPSQLQLAIIDGSCRGGTGYDHSGLKKFSHLPHLLNRPPANPEEVAEIVSFLAKEADHRLAHQIVTPQILLVIDNLQDILPVAGPEFHEQLEHILDIGPQTGIRVILATNRPEDGRLQDLIASIEIDRMTGKVQSAGQAAFASGRHDSDAECLDGNGEFLATLDGTNYHFQAAWVSERNLNRYLGYLKESKQPALVAWSIPADDDYFYDEDGLLHEKINGSTQHEFNYGFLEKRSNSEAEANHSSSFETEDVEDFDAIEEEEEIEPSTDEHADPYDYEQNRESLADLTADTEADDEQFLLFEEATRDEEELDDELEDQIEDYDDDPDASGTVSNPEEDRLTQLESIYAKLTGFWSNDPQETEAEPMLPYMTNGHVAEDETDENEVENWDELDQEQDEEVLDADEEQTVYSEAGNQPASIFHEPTSEYVPSRNGWLDYAPGDAENDEDDENEQIGNDNQLDEEDNLDDSFSFSAEEIAKPGRRSRLSKRIPQSKAQPAETPTPPAQTNTAANNLNKQPEPIEPFDPWQNGLDDEIAEQGDEQTKPTTIVRPPRLVPRKPSTLRRRVSQPSNHFKPKPKPKPTPVPEKIADENIDGEIE